LHHLSCGTITPVRPEEEMCVMRHPVHPRVCPRILLVLAVLMLASCETAYYATMEKLGYP